MALLASMLGGSSLLAVSEPAVAIGAEMPGVAEHITRFYDDAERVRQSFAVANYRGCGGALIGPHLFVTAAHCGAPADGEFRNMTITGYSVSDPDGLLEDTFSCHRVLDTFPDSDLLLMYCDRDGDPMSDEGPGPGDIYGYLDILDESPTVGAAVHSVWTNPITAIAPRQHHVIYSSGTVQRINLANQWPNPSSITWGADRCNTPGAAGYTETPLVFQTSIYGESGASGSVTLDSESNRLIGGPLSTAPGGGGLSRFSLPIAHYLDAAVTMGRNDMPGPVTSGCAEQRDDINSELMQALGLGTGSELEGGLDKDGDGVFDAQELIERKTGESTRSLYSLFFNSERQNRLWQWRRYGSIDESRYVAIMEAPSGAADSERVVLEHPGLNLPPSVEAFRGSLMMRRTGSSAGYVRVCLLAGGTRRCGGWLRSTSDWQRHAFALPMPGAGAVLQLAHWGGGQVELAGLTLSDPQSLLNFDTRDARQLWKQSHGRGIALIRPDGRRTPGSRPEEMDFAVVVSRDPVREANVDQSARYFHAGFAAEQRYEVCMQIKQDPVNPLQPGDGQGYLSLTDNRPVSEGTFLDVPFTPTDDWTRVCTTDFTAPSDAVNIYFGVDDFVSNPGSFLVDDIEINAL